eukprot:CAMPEP_0119053484 /NCGR_PEP_ID=MMETSP1177-20130426/74460_1 /TAXON_ID=2985 /ORGANISM="Ochromonas sp, Strain CCMP1899" /LENGTH=677 /DNA_ID=CAMNT_0007033453 /DNA_START=772 /DNA_END=2802 /DNA_ORIENTATION=-
MANKLSIWLPKAIDSLLLSAKQEAETFLAFSINSALAVGETLLRRRAAALLYTELDKGIKTKASLFSPPKIRSDASFNQSEEAVDLLMNAGNNPVLGTSLSLQYTEKFGNIFGLEQWFQENDLRDVIPSGYLSSPTSRGAILTDSISTELGALHKSLHMHNALGQAEIFTANYRLSRLPMIVSFIKKGDKLMKQKVKLSVVLPSLLANIIGFFLFENIFQQCAIYKSGPFSNTELTVLWDEMCSQLGQFLLRWINTLSQPEEMLLLKEDLLLFIETSNDSIFQFKHDEDKMVTVMNELWTIFEDIQLKSTIQRCRVALEDSLYQPLSVTTESQYLCQIKAFGIDDLNYNENKGSNMKLSSTDQQRYSQGTPLISTDVRMTTSSNDEDKTDTTKSKYVSTSVASANLDALEDMCMFSPQSQVAVQPETPLSAQPSASMASQDSDYQVPVHARALVPNLSSADSIDSDSRSFNDDSSVQNHVHSRTEIDIKSPTVSLNAFIPKTYPFSSAVPGILKELHLYLLRFFVFSVKNVSESKGEVICESVVKIFRFITVHFKGELEKGEGNIPLSKACQISIDASSIGLASESIWSLMTSILNHFEWGSSISSHIQSASAKIRTGFTKVTGQAQDQAFELLSNKVDDLLESSLMFIHFEPDTLPKAPHLMIDQLIDFLTVTLMW